MHPLLLRLATYIPLDRKTIIVGIFNQIILSGAAAGLIALLAYFLPKDIFGSIRYTSAALALFAFLSLPGMAPVVLQRTLELRRHNVRALLALQFLWGLIIIPLGALLALYHAALGEYDIAGAVFFASLLAPLANLYSMPGLIMAGLRRFGAKLAIDTLILLVTIAGVYAGILFSPTVLGIMLFYFGSQAIVTALALRYALRAVQKVNPGMSTSLPDALHSKQFTLLMIPSTFVPALEKIIVFFFLGPVALALYTVAVLSMEHVKNAFRNLLQYILLPHMGVAGTSHFMRGSFIIALALALGGLSALILFVLFLMPILFPGYEEIFRAALLIGLALIPLPLYVLVLMAMGERNMRLLFYYVTGTSVIAVGLMLFLTPVYGLTGAFVAKIVVEYASAFLLVMLYLTRRKKVP